MKRNYLTDLLEQIQLPREKGMAILIDAAVEIADSSEYPQERRQNILYRLATDGYFVDSCHDVLRATVAATLASAAFDMAPDFAGIAEMTESDPDLQLLFGYLLKENEIAMGANDNLNVIVSQDERDFRLGEVAQQLPC